MPRFARNDELVHVISGLDPTMTENVIPGLDPGIFLDNRSRRNNGTLTNNDDSVGTVE